MTILPWSVQSSVQVFEGRYLRVHREEVVTGKGTRIPDYHVIESPAWAGVVCVTESAELVLVRQYRHGRKGPSLELPAGIIEPGEAPSDAAARELLEETGYRATSLEPLWETHPEPARHRQTAHFYFIRASDVPEGLDLEPSEDVEVVLRPLAELDAIVAEMGHGVHVAALLLAARRGFLVAPSGA